VTGDAVIGLLALLLLGAVLVGLVQVAKRARGMLWKRRYPYRGIRFRSRTEVAWAKWFDSHGIAYQYEPQVYFFRVRGGRRVGYLPDFRLRGEAGVLRGLGPWVEIKGLPPTSIEEWKCQQLARQTGKHVTLLAGWPGRHSEFSFWPE
jgi:hypothetical protein